VFFKLTDLVHYYSPSISVQTIELLSNRLTAVRLCVVINMPHQYIITLQVILSILIMHNFTAFNNILPLGTSSCHTGHLSRKLEGAEPLFNKTLNPKS